MLRTTLYVRKYDIDNYISENIYCKNIYATPGENMETIQTKKGSTRNKTAFSAKELVGTKVLSRTGKNIGEVDTVKLHPKFGTIEGVRVSTGLIGVDHFFGKEYISKITDSAVMLNIDPLTGIVGKKVFDSRGKKVGKVTEVNREGDSNKIISLNVDRGLMQDDLLIARKAIDTIGYNVLLNQEVKA